MRPIAITDERDTCDCCGKTGLKRVVVLDPCDGNEFLFYGTTCAAIATGVASRVVSPKAQLAELQRRVDRNRMAARTAAVANFWRLFDDFASESGWRWTPTAEKARALSWLRHHSRPDAIAELRVAAGAAEIL